MKRTKLIDRKMPSYTKGEEIFNMVSHIVGGVLGILAIVLCAVFAGLNGDVYGVVSGCIFGATMLVLYTSSSIYHGLKPETFSYTRIRSSFSYCTAECLIETSAQNFLKLSGNCTDQSTVKFGSGAAPILFKVFK